LPSQPLKAEHEQQSADHEPKRLDRNHRQRRTEYCDDCRKGQKRNAGAGEGRTPAAGQPNREHDRERFDGLNRAREERRQYEKDVGQE